LYKNEVRIYYEKNRRETPLKKFISADAHPAADHERSEKRADHHQKKKDTR
jgi:hypothetical protein